MPSSRSRSRRCCGRRRGRRSPGRCCGRSRRRRSRRPRRCSWTTARAAGRRARRSRPGRPRRSRRRAGVTTSPRTASRSSWIVASPSVGCDVSDSFRPSFRRESRAVYRAAPLHRLSGPLAAPASRASTSATPSAVVTQRVALARLLQSAVARSGSPRRSATSARPRSVFAIQRSRSVTARTPSASSSAASASSSVLAGECEVGGAPERARETPAVARPPEERARLVEVLLGAPRSRRPPSRSGRGPRARARRHGGRALAPQLESLLQRGARRREPPSARSR